MTVQICREDYSGPDSGGGIGEQMSKFYQSRIFSFRNAFAGWWYVVRTQRNAWIHTVASLVVFSLSLWAGLDARDWAVIILAVAMVWTAEFLNSALEAVVDLASPEQNLLAKVGKDVGAAAVLIAAISSILIGLLILGPPLWRQIGSLLN